MQEVKTERSVPLVLTIDDEPSIRECFSDILEDNGYQVIMAENGRIGLEMIEKHRPDIILCDLQMPEVQGLEVVRRVHERYTKIPIIIISGTGGLDEALEAVRLGAWDYLVKPLFNLKTLLQAVEKALDRARLLAENEAYQKSLERRTRELQKEIEERKKTEKKLIQSEKMAALGDLVAGVAHEINTPLGIGVTGISFLKDAAISFKKLLREGNAKKSDLERFLDECQEACEVTLTDLERVARLVTSFKQIAVDQSSDGKRVFAIKQYVEEILFSLYPRIKKTKHVIRVDCPEKLMIDSFPGAFSQILTNLIMNSLLHGFEGREDGEIDIAVERDDDSIILRYKDNGKGLTEEQKDKIYHPFYTTKRGGGGTGLGMHVVYNLVTEKLGGEIQCESTLNHGILFILTVPGIVTNGS